METCPNCGRKLRIYWDVIYDEGEGHTKPFCLGCRRTIPTVPGHSSKTNEKATDAGGFVFSWPNTGG